MTDFVLRVCFCDWTLSQQKDLTRNVITDLNTEITHNFHIEAPQLSI